MRLPNQLYNPNTFYKPYFEYSILFLVLVDPHWQIVPGLNLELLISIFIVLILLVVFKNFLGTMLLAGITDYPYKYWLFFLCLVSH